MPSPAKLHKDKIEKFKQHFHKAWNPDEHYDAELKFVHSGFYEVIVKYDINHKMRTRKPYTFIDALNLEALNIDDYEV